jgi:hypothetical protein
MRIGTVSAPFTDVLNIKIDNVTVQSYPEPAIAETAYTERVIDLTAFANGASHNIQFDYIGTTTGTGSYVIDDVSVDVGPPCATPDPSPSNTPTATPTASPTCTPTERIADGTFEVGNPWTAWTVQTSTNFGTAICNTALCGTDSGTAPPFAGDNWIWFGGSTAAETATAGQNVTIPAGSPATLTFQLRIGKVITPFTDTLNVKIDGTTITTFTEPAVAESNYTLRSFDVSSFADGSSHTILFTYTGTTTGAANFTIDNVSLIGGGNCVTPTPSPVISGQVGYNNGAPIRAVPGVLLSAIGSPSVFATSSLPDGGYSLSGFGSGFYTVTPSKTGDINGSITSFDAAKIAQHVTGTVVLQGNQLLVADVSGNGTISSFDAAQIARYVAGISGSGSTGQWLFIPANRTYSAIAGNIGGQVYAEYIMGEVSGNWTSTGTRRTDPY